MKMKRIVSSALMGVLLVTTGSLAWAEEKDEKDLSAYQWGYWDKMVSPAAGPLAPVGAVASAPLPPTPIPTPDPVPPPPPIPDPVDLKVAPGWSDSIDFEVKPVEGPGYVNNPGGFDDRTTPPPPM
jgi:hypothetical protein